MKIYGVKGKQRRSPVYVGASLSRVVDLIHASNTVIITDETVYELYKDRFPFKNCIVLKEGEGSKSLDTADTIFEQLLKMGVDRSGFILGIGGGIVCDITGFTASLFMRGVRFGFVPTTLLAQVDASLGGKNGVNFQGIKNIIGLINQPRFVLIDFDFLKTLGPKERMCGFAEIIKHAAVKDRALFSLLEDNAQALKNLSREILPKIIERNVKIKLGVVNRDEKERGLRQILNFGHTMGHALEKEARISHGEAVAQGMVFASRLSYSLGFLARGEMTRLIALIARYSLPTKLTVDAKLLFTAVEKDKKRRDNKLNFILLREIGRGFIHPMEIEALKEAAGGLS